MNQSVKVPEEYLCPITTVLMEDPVVLADGFSYERGEITKWLSKGKDTSPMTGAKLKHTFMTSNQILKVLIQTFKEKLPLVQQDQQMRADMDEAAKGRELELLEYLKRKDSRIIGNDNSANSCPRHLLLSLLVVGALIGLKGLCERGVIHKGKYAFPNGYVYEGYLVDGVPEGKGKCVYSNGNYEGDWIKGNREGQGKYTFRDGSSYEGGWMNGLREGRGKYTFQDGNTYEGHWIKGIPKGVGKYVDSNRRIHKAELVNGTLKIIDESFISYIWRIISP